MKFSHHGPIKICLIFLLLIRSTVETDTETCWESIDCAMVRMFQTCLGGQENHPVVLIGSHNDAVLEKLQSFSEPLQVALIDTKDSSVEHAHAKKLYILDNYTEVAKPQPSTKFLFDEVDLPSLEAAIDNLHHSIWWNLYGNFVFKNTLTSNTCQNAYAYLKVAWKSDIVKATYVCRNSLNEVEFYTFNPFADRMPHPWEVMDIYEQENNHPFTLFKLIKKFDVCDAINFDKTSALHGYPIKIVAQHQPPFEVYDAKAQKFKGYSVPIWELAFDQLNATPHWMLYPRLGYKNVGNVYLNGSADGMLAEVLQGKYDCSLGPRVDLLLWKNQMYTYSQAVPSCVILKRMIAARLVFTKLISVESLTTFSCIFVASTLILMYFNKVSFARAALDLLRLLLNMPTLSEPLSCMGKLIFLMYLLAQIVLTTVQQGNLYSAMTAPLHDESFGSIEELLKANYKIYILDALRHEMFLGSPLFDQIQVAEDHKECIRRVQDESRSACILMTRIIPFFLSVQEKMHIISLDNYFSRYGVFLCRDNFSLHRRVSSTLLHIEESGIHELKLKSFISRYAKKDNETSTEPEPISLDQMSFAYTFIIYGWAISGIVLFIEILLGILTKFVFLSVIFKKVFM